MKYKDGLWRRTEKPYMRTATVITPASLSTQERTELLLQLVTQHNTTKEDVLGTVAFGGAVLARDTFCHKLITLGYTTQQVATMYNWPKVRVENCIARYNMRQERGQT